MIEMLESIGGHRWTHGRYDRMYFDVKRIDFGAISPRDASGILNAKFYVDLTQDELHIEASQAYGYDWAVEIVEQWLQNNLENLRK